MSDNTSGTVDLMQPVPNKYKCGHCGYEGPCYGAPTSKGVTAPWCKRCGMNNKLEKLNSD